MLKYLCLIVFMTAIYAAPLEDANNEQVQTTEVNSNTLDVTTTAVDEQEQAVVGKRLTTKRPDIVEIIESGNEKQNDGSYSFHYRGSDGTFREETAVMKNPGTDHAYLEITGAYSFFDTYGKEVIVQYKADDKGFVPVGNNIPDAISLAAKENSLLPAVKSVDQDDEEDTEDSDGSILKKQE